MSKFLHSHVISSLLIHLCGDSIEDNFDEDYEEKMVRYTSRHRYCYLVKLLLSLMSFLSNIV